MLLSGGQIIQLCHSRKDPLQKLAENISGQSPDLVPANRVEADRVDPAPVLPVFFMVDGRITQALHRPA
jgi:hypothetical protein